MEKDLLMDFAVNKENRTITVRREFAAELPVVWDAYTKSEFLDNWWAPEPWKARTRTMDFSEGGRWLYKMVGPQGEEQWSLTKFKTIQHHKGFIATDAFADEAGNINKEMPQSTWNVIFTAVGTGTIVEMVIIFPDLPQLEKILEMGMQEGLTASMESLDEVLALEQKKLQHTR